MPCTHLRTSKKAHDILSFHPQNTHTHTHMNLYIYIYIYAIHICASVL